MPELERDDIQGLIARGYRDLPLATYLLLRVVDGPQARGWLAQLTDQITSAPTSPGDTATNVAFTPNGLRQLGLPEAAIAQFSYEFSAGMTTPHRQRSFGDVGPSAPEKWLWGGPHTPPIDVLVLLFARDEGLLRERYAELAGSFSGVSEVIRLDAVHDLDGKEHFGFADGISQPTVEGLSSRVDTPPNTIRAGEFILGYENEYGLYTDRPLLEQSADPGHILPVDVEGSGKADLARNGSYLVFRQLSQDVRGFWRWVDQAVRQSATPVNPDARTRLAAKMVGRWPSGAPLVLAPDADNENLATANDFTYHYQDELGMKCPIGAHVRRSHPRDSLDPDPGTARSVALDKRHRLLRRGREYGPPVPGEERLAPAPSQDADRGIYFLCLCANISRQFEFVQHTWLNNAKFSGLYDEPDPLVGYHSSGARFSIPAHPVRERFHDMPTFVTARGGAYFFLPGIRALRYLAAIGGEPGNSSSPVGS